MSRVARVEQGLDGSYRMTVDQRYETLPSLRRTVKLLSPLWFLLLAAKSCFIGAPVQLSNEASDPLSFMTFGGSSVLSVFAWLVAALGSRSERFPGVIAFNVFTMLTVMLHAARLFQLMIQTESTNKELEALALAEVLEAGTAALARHRTVLLSVLEMLHVFVDGGLFLVGIPMASAMHMYITGKKQILKANRKRSKNAKHLFDLHLPPASRQGTHSRVGWGRANVFQTGHTCNALEGMIASSCQPVAMQVVATKPRDHQLPKAILDSARSRMLCFGVRTGGTRGDVMASG